MRRLWLFPVSAVLCLACTCVATYIISVYSGHAMALWPFISDTGTTPPESSIFTFFISLSSFLFFVSVWLKFETCKVWLLERTEAGKWRKWMLRANRALFWCGCLSALGFLITASFQITTCVHVHVVGGLMSLGFGILYALGQSILTICSCSRQSGLKCLACCRFLTSLFGLLAFPIVLICSWISFRHRGFDKSKLPVILNEKHEIYAIHVVATGAEWVLAYCFVLVLATFVYELWDVRLIPPRVLLPSMEDSDSDDTRQRSKIPGTPVSTDAPPTIFRL